MTRFVLEDASAPAAPDGARFVMEDGPEPRKRDTVSPAASMMAAEGVGIPHAAAIALGQGFDKAAMGLKELALKGVRSFAPDTFAQAADKELQQLSQSEAVKDSAYAGLQAARPFTTGMAEAGPALMATAGMGILPAAAGMAGFAALKPGSVEDRIRRGGVEGVGSLVGGYLGNKAASIVAPVASKAVNAAQKEALEVAQRIGYKPRLSEITGSPYLARLEDVAARLPGGAGVMDDFARANQQAINRRAAASIGENADELTAPVFAQASDRIGGVFQAIRNLPGKPISVTPDVGRAADEVLRISKKMVESERDPQLVALANQAKTLARNMGRLDGEAYQLIRSGLSNQSFEATGTNKALYGQLLKALDDAAETSLARAEKKELAEAFKAARPQYASLKTLEKGATAQGGDISAAKVAATLRTNNPSAFREGRMAGNPLYDIAVLGERMKPLRAGSPTMEREVTSSLLDTLIKAPYAYGAAKLTTGAVPRAYASLLATNPAAHLLTQPVAQIGQPGGGALGSLLAQRFLIPSVPVFAE